MSVVRGNFKVSQRNDLIEAYHENPLTRQQQRIVLAMASQISIEQKELTVQRLSIKEFAELCGLEVPEYGRKMQTICDDLTGKKIKIKRPHGTPLTITWVSSAEVLPKEGVVELSFDMKMAPYLIGLKGTFTSYELINSLRLQSAYSVRLYELGKKWQNTKKKTFQYGFEELRKMLGATKKTYEMYGSFKKKILTPGMEEINEQTDIKMRFEDIKKGRKVVGVRFWIEPAAKKKRKKKDADVPAWFEEQQKEKEKMDSEREKKNREKVTDPNDIQRRVNVFLQAGYSVEDVKDVMKDIEGIEKYLPIEQKNEQVKKEVSE